MFLTKTPANNGTINLFGNNKVIVVASSASALTFITPTVTSVMRVGTEILVTNTLAGAITVRNPANSATLGVVLAGTIRSFKLTGSGVWELLTAEVAVASYGTVAQGGSITSGVTINTLTGVIDTAATDLAAGARTSFVVTNNTVLEGATVIASVGSYASAGLPQAVATKVTAGGFTVVLENRHASTGLNDVVPINFRVINL